MKKNNFKKINSLIFSLFIIISFVYNPIEIKSQAVVEPKSYNEEDYKPLAPLPGFDKLTKGTGGFSFQDPCPLGKFLNLFIDLFIGIVAVLSMIMIVMGGINYVMSDLVTSKEDAKNNIQNAILGLVIALTCYLVLNTINPNLLNLCLDGISKVSIELEDIPQKAVDGYYGNGQFKSGARWDDSIAQLSKLPRGVTVNKNECTTIGQQNCTSVRGLNTYIINTIANGCWESQGKKDCNIIITGGTENWLHSASGTHRPGSSTIDLSPTADINKYLTGKTTPPTPNTKLIKNGINYYYHENHGAGGYHWHIYQ